MDSWLKWKIVCLTMMSVKDVEDVYTFGFLITGFLLFGLCAYLVCREIPKTSAAVQSIPKLPRMFEGICRALNSQTEMLREQNRKLDTTLVQNHRLTAVPGLRGEMIYSWKKLYAQIYGKYQKFGYLDLPLSDNIEAKWKITRCIPYHRGLNDLMTPIRKIGLEPAHTSKERLDKNYFIPETNFLRMVMETGSPGIQKQMVKPQSLKGMEVRYEEILQELADVIKDENARH